MSSKCSMADMIIALVGPTSAGWPVEARPAGARGARGQGGVLSCLQTPAPITMLPNRSGSINHGTTPLYNPGAECCSVERNCNTPPTESTSHQK